MATASRPTGKGVRQDEREAALVDLRHTLDWMGDEIHVIEAPVDPIVEMAAISKAFDNSKALVAETVRGYPDARLISNLWATKERCARLFGVDEFKDIKFKLLESLRAPIAPRTDRAARGLARRGAVPGGGAAPRGLRARRGHPAAHHPHRGRRRAVLRQRRPLHRPALGAGRRHPVFLLPHGVPRRPGIRLRQHGPGRPGRRHLPAMAGRENPGDDKYLPAAGDRDAGLFDVQLDRVSGLHRRNRHGRRAAGLPGRDRQGADRGRLRHRPVGMGARRLHPRGPARMGDRRGRGARPTGRGAAPPRMGALHGPCLPYAARVSS